MDCAGPATAPLNVTSEVTSSTSIYVKWDEIPMIDRNGNITEYEVHYVPIDEGLNEHSDNTTDLEFIILNLKEFTNYSITVRAYTSVGPGPYTVPIINQTFEDCKCILEWSLSLVK